MKILIVGNLGMLGADLMEAAASRHEVAGVDRQELDITDISQCMAFLNRLRPDAVINAAALTQVDYCESHWEEALLVNGQGPGNLAQAAASTGALLVHYSTDYVFDGLKMDAYTEEDQPNPCSAYGRSKLRGEELIRSLWRDHLIVRTAWLFGRNGTNFLRTILHAATNGQPLRVVNDQRGSPTYSKDLAAYTMGMIEGGCRGTYHLTNAGSCSWYELALCAVEWVGLRQVKVTPVSTSEFPRPAPRPANSVLANARLAAEGFAPMRPWREAAREYVRTLRNPAGGQTGEGC
ncbi:MAG TPA: dTDP-4-dehydrorhamnose reductase [Acidobacteriota bacterium]|nr:dTDP-4-dehydrorhamnose reductase [Acidobacteriota bacterium]